MGSEEAASLEKWLLLPILREPTSLSRTINTAPSALLSDATFNVEKRFSMRCASTLVESPTPDSPILEVTSQKVASLIEN